MSSTLHWIALWFIVSVLLAPVIGSFLATQVDLARNLRTRQEDRRSSLSSDTTHAWDSEAY